MNFDALHRANLHLIELQQQARQHRLDRGLPVDGGIEEEMAVSSWSLANGQKALKTCRDRDGVVEKVNMPSPYVGDGDMGEIADDVARSHILDLPACSSAAATSLAEQVETPICGDAERLTVKHYPSLGVAAYKGKYVAVYRLWLTLRFLDPQGRGWLPLADVKEALTSQNQPLYLYTWRRLRSIMNSGNKSFWTLDKNKGRIWVYGAAKIATTMNVPRLEGRPVALRLDELRSLGKFKAALYASWHAGRGRQAYPVSRETQAAVMGVPDRTQRHYCQIAGIQRQPNYVIDERQTRDNAQEYNYQHGRAMFTIDDVKGKHGPPKRRYNARQIASTHTANHQTLPKGRQRRINHYLRQDLVTKGMQGNSQTMIVKRYYPNGYEAAKAHSKRPYTPHYWKLYKKEAYTIWSVFY